jgi:hypothetical protein
MKFSLPLATALASLTSGVAAMGASTDPTASDYTQHVTDTTAVIINVLAKDHSSDTSALTVSSILAVAPTKGTATVMSDGTILYTPTAGTFAGSDSFKYTVIDGSNRTAIGTVTLTSSAITPKPDFVNLSRIAPVTIPVTANDLNPDHDTFTVTGFSKLPATGIVYRSAQAVTYIPAADFAGVDTFTYEITDSYKRTASAQVTVSLVNLSAGAVVRKSDGTVAGYLTVDALPGGAFSGVLQLDGKRYRLLGLLDAKQQFNGFARTGDGQVIPVALAFAEANGVMLLAAALPDGMSAAEEVGHLTDNGKIDAHGRYTVTLPITSATGVATTPTNTGTVTSTSNGVTLPDNATIITKIGGTFTEVPAGSVVTGATTTGTSVSDSSGTTSSSVPQGTGWMTIKVSGNGHVGVKGMAGDGSKFGAKGVLTGTDAQPEVVLFLTPKHSVISGTLVLGDKVSGTLGWTKSSSGSDFYPEGFDVTIGASGARYDEASSGKRALPESSTFAESGGRVGDFTSDLHISKDDRGSEVNFSDLGLTLKVRRHSGVFSGAFTSPDDSSRHVHFSGVIVQGTTVSGAGVFQGDHKTGKVTLGETSSTATSESTGDSSGSSDSSSNGSSSDTQFQNVTD